MLTTLLTKNMLINKLSLLEVYWRDISPSHANNSIIYGPVSPGRGKTSIFVYLFFERQSWCGLGNVDIKVRSSVTFLKWTSDLNYWRKIFKKIFFIDFLMDLLRDFYITLKIMPTWTLKISLYMAPTYFLLHTLKVKHEYRHFYKSWLIWIKSKKSWVLTG